MATSRRATSPPRQAKNACDDGRGVGPGGLGVYLDFRDAFKRLGRKVLDERYGNLFEMYERITGEDPHDVPMRIYPAVHYTMGGLWVDYNLMSNLPGLFVGGEANFSDHGANRLGASALMQGLADGYFVLPATVGDYLARGGYAKIDTSHPAVKDAEREVNERTKRLMSIGGTKSADQLHRELGNVLWNDCGMARSKDSLTHALSVIPELREKFYKELRVTGSGSGAQPAARAGRPRGRLLRARRAHVLRRAPAERVVRRPLPRRVPDVGRRGAAKRRRVRVRGGLGVGRASVRRPS